MNSETVKVDLGCGTNKVSGTIGIDQAMITGVDVVGKLDSLPFRENSVDEVYISHVLEHAPSLTNVMEEIWRICRPNARLHIWAPHFSCGLYAWSDPTHERTLTTLTFDYWSPDSPLNYYSSARFTVTMRELHWILRDRSPYIKHSSKRATKSQLANLKTIIANLIERIANFNRFSQLLCERVWGPWVGFEEVYFELSCVKEKAS